jgi:hypothetical protein
MLAYAAIPLLLILVDKIRVKLLLSFRFFEHQKKVPYTMV